MQASILPDRMEPCGCGKKKSNSKISQAKLLNNINIETRNNNKKSK